ncbi:hypothetical protein GEMRC1_010457 [Eukaryota sp. GEM-RC1]
MSFSFGQPTTQQQTTGSTPSFSFGQPTTQQQTTGSTPSFSFGQSPTQQQTTGSTPSFSFGQPTTQQQTTGSTPSFSFGQPTTQQQTTGSTPSFSFGQPTTQQQTTGSTPSFSFGQPSTQQQTTGSTPSFSFGQPSTQQQTTGSTPSFSFGQPSTQPPSSLPSAALTLRHITSTHHLLSLSPMIAFQLIASAYDHGPAGVFKWLLFSKKTQPTTSTSSFGGFGAGSSLFGGTSSFGTSSFGSSTTSGANQIVTEKPSDIDMTMWSKALERNPNPSEYGIVVIRSPQDLINRVTKQKETVKTQLSSIEEIKRKFLIYSRKSSLNCGTRFLKSEVGK